MANVLLATRRGRCSLETRNPEAVAFWQALQRVHLPKDRHVPVCVVAASLELDLESVTPGNQLQLPDALDRSAEDAVG